MLLPHTVAFGLYYSPVIQTEECQVLFPFYISKNEAQIDKSHVTDHLEGLD